MDAFGELREKMRLRILRKNNKGIAVIFLAIAIVVLCAFVGLAVDIGYMYVAKGQLQNAADAAALAGAARIKPNDLPVYQQYSARSYAQTFASNNNAAQSPVAVASDYRTNDLSTATVSNGNDIQFGHWTPAGFDASPPLGTPINAIRVRARRTVPGDTVSAAEQGQVRIFFGKILALLPGGGAGFPFMSASAEAIAALEPAPFLPVMVNEYWLATDSNQPYGSDQNYPNSFVRVTNVDGTASKVYSKIFAVLGEKADDNINPSTSSKDMNGFIDLAARSSNHDGSGSSWYALNTGISATPACLNCSSAFSTTGLYDPSTGVINSAKFDASLGYLFNGYPSNFILPTAIKEQYRSTYPVSNYPIPTSSCPYATIAFFSGSGKSPLNKKNAGGQSFSDIYRPGKKVISLVYD